MRDKNTWEKRVRYFLACFIIQVNIYLNVYVREPMFFFFI